MRRHIDIYVDYCRNCPYEFGGECFHEDLEKPRWIDTWLTGIPEWCPLPKEGPYEKTH